MKQIIKYSLIGAVAISACKNDSSPLDKTQENIAHTATVAETVSQAVSSEGYFISWKEHLIDSEDINGGVAIRGGDGLVLGDIDRDGIQDIISVHEDSNHLRIAFGTPDPDRWELMTLSEGASVGAIEDVAVGDINNDGWPDVIAACEDAHLIYFQNPGDNIREALWPSLIPDVTTGRGSWLRVFIADIDGDGRNDITAANKGSADLSRPEAGDPANGTTSLFTFTGPPLRHESWQEHVLLKDGIPNTAMPVDFNGDGRLDVLAAARVRQQLFLLENTGTLETGGISVKKHIIDIQHPPKAAQNWTGLANAFHSDFADLNQDGRIDLVLNVIERETGNTDHMSAGLAWLEQPETPDQSWNYHAIGQTLPDWVIGLKTVDIDGDGDLDAITGGYSGLNILAGTYSGASRDFDEPSITPSASVARLAWFENTGDPSQSWRRHDISRRVRGMYDMFVPTDLDSDGDIDIIATRGNSGEYDGVFWLEQIRTQTPQRAFTPARKNESAHLPLPPPNWQELYDNSVSYIAPNKLKKTTPE